MYKVKFHYIHTHIYVHICIRTVGDIQEASLRVTPVTRKTLWKSAHKRDIWQPHQQQKRSNGLYRLHDPLQISIHSVLPQHYLSIFLMTLKYLNWIKRAPDCLQSADLWSSLYESIYMSVIYLDIHRSLFRCRYMHCPFPPPHPLPPKEMCS